MPGPDLPAIEPTLKASADLVLPASLDLRFEGFTPEAFALLARLRAHPHIDQYREEKTGIQAYIKGPFKRYRDDLVVNWVLPNRLGFETEKNVFSRLLKNDFGAGGCHHHLWMAFYRPGRKRLTDVQLSHSLSPDGFTVGLYVGDYAVDLLRQAQQRIDAEPPRFLALLNDLLETGRWRFYYYGRRDERVRHAEPLPDVPEGLAKAQGLWVRTVYPREDVLRWKGELVRHALAALLDLWPLYRFVAEDLGPRGPVGGP